MAHLVFVETSRPGTQALAAAKRLGHRVTLLTSPLFDWLVGDGDRAAAKEHVDELIWIDSTQEPDQVLAAVEAVVRKGPPVEAVLTVWQLAALPAALAAERLGLRGSSPVGIANARDKHRCRELMDEHGIPNVRHRLVRSLGEALEALRHVGYPAIVKPRRGGAKLVTALVENEAQVVAHFATIEAQHAAVNDAFRIEIPHEYLVEELAQGPLYSMELACDDRGTWSPLVVVRRKLAKHNPVIEMGSTVPSGLSAAQYAAASDYMIRLGRALGLRTGIFHIEFIYTREGPRLVEVNPRIAGGPIPDLVRTATGVDLFELLVRINLGEPIDPQPLVCRSAASHTFVAALEDATVRADLPADWFEPFRRRITNGHCDIKPGQALKKMDSNLNLYGVLRVAADDYTQAVRATEALRADVEAALQVKLIETDVLV